MSEQQNTEAVVEQTSPATAADDSPAESIPAEHPNDGEGTDTNAQTSTEASEDPPSQAPSDQEGVDVGNDADEAEFYLPVYKGQVCPVDPANRAEITELLQLGMHQRDMTPLMDELRSLAHDCGAGSIQEFIQKSRETYEKDQLAAAVKDFGEKKGREYYEFHKAQREAAFKRRAQAAADDAAKSAGAIEERLAEEFMELQALHPELTDIRSVPKAVLQLRHKHGIALQDAYNRYTLQNQRKSADQQQNAAAAAKAATGSLKDTVTQEMDPALAAFINASRRRQ